MLFLHIESRTAWPYHRIGRIGSLEVDAPRAPVEFDRPYNQSLSNLSDLQTLSEQNPLLAIVFDLHLFEATTSREEKKQTKAEQS